MRAKIMLFAVLVDKYVGAGEDTSTHYPCTTHI